MQPRLTPLGRSFTAASIRVLCLIFAISSVIWMLIDTGHWDGVCDWVMSIVRGIDFSRRTVQWIGIFLPLFILITLRWRSFPKVVLVLFMLFLLLCAACKTLSYVASAAYHSFADGLEAARIRAGAPRVAPDRPDLRLDPHIFNKLNPFNDIPAPPTIVKFNVPNDATSDGGNATDPNNTNNQQH